MLKPPRSLPWAVFVAIAAALLFLLATIPPGAPMGVAFDDTWIHLSFARTFVETGRWALTPDDRVSTGTTGYLWGLILAAGLALGLSPGAAAVIPALAAFVGLVAAWRQLARRALPEAPLYAELSAAGVALCGNLLFLAASGMEAVPALFLAILAIERHLAGAALTRDLVCVLLALIRPEGCLVGFVIALSELLRDSPLRERLRRSARAALAPCFGLGLLFSVNIAICYRALPDTFQGRRWLAALPPDIDYRPMTLARSAVQYGRDWWEDLRDHTLSLAVGGREAGEWTQGVDARLGGLWLIAAGAALAWTAFAGPPAIRIPLAFILLHNLLYIVVLPTPGPAGRYQPMNFLLLAGFPALGLGALQAKLASARRPLLGVAIFVVVLSGLNATHWWRATGSAAAHLEEVHCSLARYVATNLPAQARVAAFDFGALAYLGQRGVIDYGGLTSAVAARALHNMRTLMYLKTSGATHLSLLITLEGPQKMALAAFGLFQRRGEGGPRWRLHKLASFSVPRERFWHYWMTGNAGPQLDLYRIEWLPES